VTTFISPDELEAHDKWADKAFEVSFAFSSNDVPP